jgi:hypothetical protein
MGAVLADTHSGANYMSGCEVPPSILTFLGSLSLSKAQRINQCELLALVSAVFSFSRILRGRNVVVWVDNVATLKAAVDGHCHAPEMAVLANALHLLMAGINMRAYFLHVPGKANPADIPSRVPFVPHGNSFRLDPRLLKEPGDALAVQGIAAEYHPMLVPLVSQLADLTSFICPGDHYHLALPA